MHNIKIYTGRHPEKVFFWAKLLEKRVVSFAECQGIPFHPRDVVDRVRDFCEKGINFISFSDVALSAAAEMQRHRKIQSLQYHFLHTDKSVSIVQVDVNGDTVEPWPDTETYDLWDAGFCCRYGKTMH